MASSLRTKLRIAGTVLGCRGFFDALAGRFLWQKITPGPTAAGGINPRFAGGESEFPRYRGPGGNTTQRTTLRGAIHVHTCTYSDGAGTIEEVMDAARRAGVDFVLLTDHNTMRPKADGLEEKYANQTPFLIVGDEITVEGGAFLLALDLPGDFEFPVKRPPQEAIDAVLAAGGLPLVSLPFDMKHPWEAWNATGCEGLEVLNLSTVAREQINPLSLLLWLLPLWAWKGELAVISSLCARPDAALARWDAELMAGKKSVGLGALDAHALMKIGKKKYPIPSYENSFRAVTTHVRIGPHPPAPSPEPLRIASGRGGEVIAAIRAGECYFAYDCLGDARGMEFILASPRSSPPLSPPRGYPDARGLGGEPGERATLHARAPDPKALVRLYFRGKVVAAGWGELTFTTKEPGAYRVEVYKVARRVGPVCLGARPWIFTNPIYVR